MQVDPMTINLKPAGTERLKLKCDDPLRNFAFNFNLRRCNKDGSDAGPGGAKKEDDDKERAEMRVQIQSALQKRYADQLSNVTYAASEAGAYTRSLFSST